MKTRYPLAPMSVGMWVVTLICLAVPVGLLVAASRTPSPVHTALLATGGVVVALYAFVGLYLRPVAFELDPDGLAIHWPLRTRRIAVTHLRRARVLDDTQIHNELAQLVRIGAGGLWGGFGYAKTSQGTVELWVSRTDRMVFVECDGCRSLLITPRDMDAFVAAFSRN